MYAVYYNGVVGWVLGYDAEDELDPTFLIDTFKTREQAIEVRDTLCHLNGKRLRDVL